MIDSELLDILACPQTRQPLRMANPAELQALNERLKGGEVKNVGGDSVAGVVEGGLVREDGQILYPIRDGIPVLLVHEGIAL